MLRSVDSFTSTAAATATMTFEGDALAVYGTVSPDHADILFSIDGNSQTVMPGNGGLDSVLHAQTLLVCESMLFRVSPSSYIMFSITWTALDLASTT